jgi:hypothetical protein
VALARDEAADAEKARAAWLALLVLARVGPPPLVEVFLPHSGEDGLDLVVGDVEHADQTGAGGGVGGDDDRHRAPADPPRQARLPARARQRCRAFGVSENNERVAQEKGQERGDRPRGHEFPGQNEIGPPARAQHSPRCA